MRIDGWVILDGSWQEIPCDFLASPSDPFAVKVSFGGVEWLIARDLLQEGLDRPAGQGDVRLWPTHGPVAALFIFLAPPTGEALIELPRGRVRDFLAKLPPPPPITDEALDAELRQLLNGGEVP